MPINSPNTWVHKMHSQQELTWAQTVVRISLSANQFQKWCKHWKHWTCRVARPLEPKLRLSISQCLFERHLIMQICPEWVSETSSLPLMMLKTQVHRELDKLPSYQVGKANNPHCTNRSIPAPVVWCLIHSGIQRIWGGTVNWINQ